MVSDKKADQYSGGHQRTKQPRRRQSQDMRWSPPPPNLLRGSFLLLPLAPETFSHLVVDPFLEDLLLGPAWKSSSSCRVCAAVTVLALSLGFSRRIRSGNTSRRVSNLDRTLTAPQPNKPAPPAPFGREVDDRLDVRVDVHVIGISVRTNTLRCSGLVSSHGAAAGAAATQRVRANPRRNPRGVHERLALGRIGLVVEACEVVELVVGQHVELEQ